MSLSEFGNGFSFADDDDNENPSSLVSDSMSSSDANQGGGEGQLCEDEADEIVETTTDSSAGAGAAWAAEKEEDNQKLSASSTKLETNGNAVAVIVNNVPFRTFLPRGRRQRQISEVVNGCSSQNKRPSAGSTMELNNGECYLAIEPGQSDSRSLLPASELEPSVYRGGVGSLPRHGLAYQQELLEASLNSSLNVSRAEEAAATAANGDCSNGLRKSESRNSLFGRKKKKHQRAAAARGQSLPRGESGRFTRQESAASRVAARGKDMF
jgi:hypothetical protein